MMSATISRIETMFGSSLPPVVCWRVHLLFTLCFCFIFLRFVYPMLPVSLDCHYLIAPSVFSNVYRRDDNIIDKMYHKHGTVSKSNTNIVERDQSITINIHRHDRTISRIDEGTSIESEMMLCIVLVVVFRKRA